jgi:hypothetical protein
MICTRCNEEFDEDDFEGGYYGSSICQNCQWDLQWIEEEQELEKDDD